MSKWRGGWLHLKKSSAERRTVNGVVYASIAEARFAEGMYFAKESLISWGHHQPVVLGDLTYRPDFHVRPSNDYERWYEIKGLCRPKRRKGCIVGWAITDKTWPRTRDAWRKHGPGPLIVLLLRGNKWIEVERIVPDNGA